MSWSLLGVKGLLRELNLLITRQEIFPFNIYTICRKVTRSKKNINKEILIDLTSNPYNKNPKQYMGMVQRSDNKIMA